MKMGLQKKVAKCLARACECVFQGLRPASLNWGKHKTDGVVRHLESCPFGGSEERALQSKPDIGCPSLVLTVRPVSHGCLNPRPNTNRYQPFQQVAGSAPSSPFPLLYCPAFYVQEVKCNKTSSTSQFLLQCADDEKKNPHHTK